MIATFGYYIIFLFNVVLTAFLSLIIYYLNNKNSSHGELNFFCSLSIIIVSLVTATNSYSQLSSDSAFLLPALIISLFIFLGFFLNKRIESNQELVTYMLFIFTSILIGMGFYVSAISSLAVLFSMKYFLNGVFNFFTDYKEDLLDEESEQIVNVDDLKSQSSGLDEQNPLSPKLRNDKINGK